MTDKENVNDENVNEDCTIDCCTFTGVGFCAKCDFNIFSWFGELDEQSSSYPAMIAKFTKNRGWELFEDEVDDDFISLRHYFQSDEPYGLGFAGEVGWKKFIGLVSGCTVSKSYIDNELARQLVKLAEKADMKPEAYSMKEWGDCYGMALVREVMKA